RRVKNTRGGGRRSARNNGLPIDFGSLPTITSLAVDTVNSNIVYAGSTTTFSNYTCAGIAGGGSVYKSTDGGTAWIASSNGLTGRVFSLAINPTNTTVIYAGP